MKKILAQVTFFLLISLFSTTLFSQGSISSFSKILTKKDVNVVPDIDKDGVQITENGKPKTKINRFAKWFNVEEIKLYGAGNVLGLVTGNNDIEETTAPTGSIGLNFTTNKLTCDLFFSYNSKQKIEVNTLGQFGNTLMNPNLGGQSFTFKVAARMKKFYGLSTSVTVADNIYMLGDNEIDASPFILRLGGYASPFIFSTVNKINLTFDLHFTHRSILGDFSNEEQTIEDKKILDRGYNGIDLSLNAFLNDVHIFVQFSFNEKDNDFLIPGFSGTQVLFGLEVSGNFIKLK